MYLPYSSDHFFNDPGTNVYLFRPPKLQWAQGWTIPLACATQIMQKYPWKNTIFYPFLTHFWSQNNPFSRYFVVWSGQNGLQWDEKGLISLVCAPQIVIFKAFWDFGRAKTGHHELKTRQKCLFRYSMLSKIIFEKKNFLH